MPRTRLLSLLALLAGSIFFGISCDDTGGGGGNDGQISGLVQGFATGGNPAALANALIEFLDLGVTATTDTNGRFMLADIGDIPAGGTLVRVSADGFGSIWRRVFVDQALENFVSFLLLQAPPNQTATLPTTANTAISIIQDAFEVSVEPGDLVDASGMPVTGTIEMQLIPYQAGNALEQEALPAPFVADMGTFQTQLITYGMFQLSFFQAGQELQIADGETIDVYLEIDADRQTIAAGAQPVYWSLNKETGLWEMGPDSEYDPELGIWAAHIEHLSVHNPDYYLRMMMAPPESCVVVNTFGRDGCSTSLSVSIPDYTQSTGNCFTQTCLGANNIPASPPDLTGGSGEFVTIRYPNPTGGTPASLEQVEPLTGIGNCSTPPTCGGSCREVNVVVPCLAIGEECPVVAGTACGSTAVSGSVIGCCAGLTCIDGFCTDCQGNGQACVFDSDCCTGACSGGFCGQAGVRGSCSSNSDCLGGDCGSGVCNCKPPGQSCGGNAECCNQDCSGGFCATAQVGAACLPGQCAGNPTTRCDTSSSTAFTCRSGTGGACTQQSDCINENDTCIGNVCTAPSASAACQTFFNSIAADLSSYRTGSAGGSGFLGEAVQIGNQFIGRPLTLEIDRSDITAASPLRVSVTFDSPGQNGPTLGWTQAAGATHTPATPIAPLMTTGNPFNPTSGNQQGVGGFWSDGAGLPASGNYYLVAYSNGSGTLPGSTAVNQRVMAVCITD